VNQYNTDALRIVRSRKYDRTTLHPHDLIKPEMLLIMMVWEVARAQELIYLKQRWKKTGKYFICLIFEMLVSAPVFLRDVKREIWQQQVNEI